MPMPVNARDRLETIVADYHHAHRSVARAQFSGPSGGPLRQHAAALTADGLIAGTLTLTAANQLQARSGVRRG
jgi:hypothetical protein